MRVWIATVLRRLADWLDAPPPPAPIDVIELVAVTLMRRAAESAEGTSGEYKRHVVYAGLQKAFPGEPKRRLSLAIETLISRGVLEEMA